MCSRPKKVKKLNYAKPRNPDAALRLHCNTSRSSTRSEAPLTAWLSTARPKDADSRPRSDRQSHQRTISLFKKNPVRRVLLFGKWRTISRRKLKALGPLLHGNRQKKPVYYGSACRPDLHERPQSCMFAFFRIVRTSNVSAIIYKEV